MHIDHALEADLALNRGVKHTAPAPAGAPRSPRPKLLKRYVGFPRERMVDAGEAPE